MINNLYDQTWETPEYESYTLPAHLSPQARVVVASMGSLDNLCRQLVRFFSRFKDIMPTERLYTQDQNALSGLRLANLKYHGLKTLLSQAERNLAALEQCTAERPCELIGCPTCSTTIRSHAISISAKYICSSISYNLDRGSETVVLSVTIANRDLWCRPLKCANEVLTGRRNSLRSVIKLLAAQELGSYGRITDVLASLDIKYESPIDSKLHNSPDHVMERLNADCDIHIHALICFTPYHQQFRQDRDWAKLVQRHLRQLLPPPFDLKVQHLDHEITRERLIRVGIQKSDLNPLVESVVYHLAYQSKTTTLDSVSSRERPLIQAAIAGPLKHGKGIMQGKPILLRSRRYEDVAQSLANAETECAYILNEIEIEADTERTQP